MTDRWRRRAVRAVRVAALGAIAYFGAALVAIHWPRPGPFEPRPAPNDVEAQASLAATSDAIGRVFEARDGASLHSTVHAATADPSAPADAPVVLLLHGVTASAAVLDRPARKMAASIGASVIALDLRGHGRSGGAPFDVAYLGQYEHDVADVVAALRRERASRPIVLAGHSMGGGIALRYALLRDAPAVDGYLLIAPLLGGGAPSMRRPTAAQAQANDHVRIHIARLVGLFMLDAVAVRRFHHLPVLFFDTPSGMPGYTFFALGSMQPNAPLDYAAALRAVDAPLLVVAGGSDATFRAAAYPSIVREHSAGESLVVAGESHVGILESPPALERIRAWLPRRGSGGEVAR